MKRFALIAFALAAAAVPASAQYVSDAEPFITAVRERDGNKVTEMIDKRPTIVNSRNLKGETALVIAISRTDELWTTYLLGKGANLAAALPEAHVHLVESVSRKCAFLERAIEAAGLSNASVVCRRAEAWPEGIGTCDAVTVRAVAPLDVLAEYAAPLLRDGGALIAWKGRREPAEEAAGDRAAELLGLGPSEVHAAEPFRGADHRHLYVYLKVAPTPSRYPRREGMARKRPLGGSTAA